MASEAPPFWWEKPDWRAYALWPFSALYGAVARYRLNNAPRRQVDVPVICVGNFTVGGTGKTPVAIALAAAAKAVHLTPGFLSRGHGGSFSQPHLVDPHHDVAKHVGDEPLLLADHAPVAVTANRAAGAKLLAEQGCDLLIMDDGFQSARIHIDYALIVIDSNRGLGNGHIIPGGPMRAPLLDQLRFADAVLKMGEGDGADAVVRMASRANKPVFEAALQPRPDESVVGRRFLAFAGIGDPGKFFETVRQMGGLLERSRPFPDHHVYTAEDFAELTELAEKEGLTLVTTAKDAVRLRHGTAEATEFLAKLHIVEVDAMFVAGATPARIIDEALAACRKRAAAASRLKLASQIVA